jgi:hypothetical protein
MKQAFLTSSISLIAGLCIGAYVGHRSYDRHVTNEAVQQVVESGESPDRERAGRAVRAIELIQSGQSNAAVDLLSRPIADFYQFHIDLTHSDQRTRDLITKIEQLASTNAVVADAVHANKK